jgi:hypothetical protein
MKFKTYIRFSLALLLLVVGCTSCIADTYTGSYLAETPVPKPDVGYSVIDIERGSSTKCILDIRLPNRISEDEIKHIAEYINQNEGADCSPLFIYYFLPDEEPGIDGAWAYSWFNPQLEVKINGMNLETEATLEASIPRVDENVIGTWLDTWGLAHTVVIRKVNGVYQMTSQYSDGSGETITLIEKVVNGEERLYEESGIYMVIENNGNLGVYDNQGLIYECEPK